MYVISKDFAFQASHVLTGLPDGHKCGRLHGHGYVIRVELSSTGLDEAGFVLDYGELAPFGEWIDQHLDHRHLNDVIPDIQPSAENLALYLHDIMTVILPDVPGLMIAIGVSETPKTWAWWRP